MTSGWEIVHHMGSGERTDRLRIDGGWLYRTRTWSKNDGPALALTFVPDVGPIVGADKIKMVDPWKTTEYTPFV